MLPSTVDEIYKVEKKFIDEIDERKNDFGKFSKKDYPTIYNKKTSAATQTCQYMIVYKAVFITNSGYYKYSSVTKEIFVILLFP